MKNLILIIIVIHSVLACTKVIHKNIIDIQSIIEKSNNHIQKYKQSLNNNVDLEPSESAIEDNILQYLTVSSDDIKRYEGSLYSIQKLYYDFKGKDTDFYIRKIYMQKAQHLLKEVECFEKDFIYNCKLLKQKETIAYYKTKDFLMENLNSYGKMMGEYMGDVKLKMQYLAAFFLEIDLIDCLDACEEMSQKCDNIHADAKRKFEKMIKRALLAKNSFDEDQDEKHNNTEQNDTKATSDLSKVSNAQKSYANWPQILFSFEKIKKYFALSRPASLHISASGFRKRHPRPIFASPTQSPPLSRSASILPLKEASPPLL